jgi:hypothetical protein
MKHNNWFNFIQIVDALEATLAGRDYPPNTNGFYTDWKLSMGIAHMCRHAPTRLKLREYGLVPLLGRALKMPDAKPKLISRSLEALWCVSEP